MVQRLKKTAMAAAALAALVLGGSALAGAATSQSSTTTGTTPSSGSGSSTTPTKPRFNGPAPGSRAHEGAEKPVTSSGRPVRHAQV